MHTESCAPHFLELLIHIAFGSVDVVMGAELCGKVTFLIAAAHGHDSVAKFVCIWRNLAFGNETFHSERTLNSEVTQSTKSLNGHQFAKSDILLADGIEDRDASAENWCVLDRIHVCRDTNNSFGAKENVFCISSITCDPVDSFVLAHLEHSSLAALAGEVMTSITFVSPSVLK
jgi:hypothetical protein